MHCGMLSRLSCFAVLAALASGCGPSLVAPGSPQALGSLADRRPLSARVDEAVTVPFDVLLPCVQGTPMGDLASASARVADPAGTTKLAMPSWRTEPSEAYSCQTSKYEGIAHVVVTFVPRAAGTWAAETTLEPDVGTFVREIAVAP